MIISLVLNSMFDTVYIQKKISHNFLSRMHTLVKIGSNLHEMQYLCRWILISPLQMRLSESHTSVLSLVAVSVLMHKSNRLLRNNHNASIIYKTIDKHHQNWIKQCQLVWKQYNWIRFHRLSENNTDNKYFWRVLQIFSHKNVTAAGKILIIIRLEHRGLAKLKP